MWGSFVTISLLMIDDVVIFWRGLAGGPFEERKRRAVVVGMYAQFSLILIFLAFSIFGTVFLTSDQAEKECWSKQPCNQVQSIVPYACISNDLGTLAQWNRELNKTTELTPVCQQLEQLWSKGTVGNCLETYLDLAGEYGKAVYNESAAMPIQGTNLTTAPFNQGYNESAVTCQRSSNSVEGTVDKYSGNLTSVLDSTAKEGSVGFGFYTLIAGTFLSNVQQSQAEGFDPNSEAYQDAADASSYFPNLNTNMAVFLLRAFGIIDPTTPFVRGDQPIPENYTGLMLEAPWYKECDGPSGPLSGCQEALGSTCDQWDIIISFDDSKDEKKLFMACICVGWASILLSILVYLLSFNNFTDYTSDEAWIATVNQIGGFLGWSTVLKNSVTEAGFTASEELGVLLRKLFGGIDMDLTDRVLGAYLASERRNWRRLRTVVAKLELHGYTMKKQPGCCGGLFDGTGIDGYGLGELKSVVEGMSGSLSANSLESGNELENRLSCLSGAEIGAESSNETARKRRGSSDLLISNLDSTVLKVGPMPIVPLTPFARSTGIVTNGENGGVAENGRIGRVSETSTARSSVRSTTADRSIEVAYSFVRLDSSIRSFAAEGKSLSLDEDTERATEELAKHKASKLGRRKKHNSSSGMSLGSVASIAIKDDTKAIKLMVPVDLSQIEFSPPISSRDAARLCMDDNLGHVPSDTLQNALRYSWFAKAAYGLQTKRWKASATGDRAVDCIDGILSSKCFPNVLGSAINVQERFKKRNFDAILEHTGIPPEDVLFVSYTNTTFGALPFLVMLDRASSKVVISIRGTAGLEDLITDLLSNPVAMNDMLPRSILEGCEGTEIYAHAGIMSSAKAIIHALEHEGVLGKIDEIGGISGIDGMDRTDAHEVVREQSKAFSRHISSLRADSEIEFSLERAQTAVFDAIVVQNYDVVVTGHSLGAAVASLVSVVLKEKYPTLTCWAFNPPGGLVSPELSKLAAPYITSVIVGYDAISRLGIKNVKDLVDDMVFSLCRCKRPKLKIGVDVLLSKRKDALTAPRTYCSFDDVDDDVKSIIVEYIEHSLVHKADLEERLLVPLGQMLFMRPYVSAGGVEWDAVFAEPEDIVSEGILLSKLSFKHHRLPCVIEAIEACVAEAQEREARGGNYSV